MHSDLIKRLEDAEAGSAALDRDVARVFGWHRVEPRHTRNKHGGWIAPEDFLGVYSDGRPRLDSLHGTDIWRDPPRFTTSIDAAVALVERVMHQRGPININICLAGSAQAQLYPVDPCGPHDEAVAPTPALALCIALLKALKTEGA